MVRGCKKNVVYIKNTGSTVFKEAFFVIGDEKAARDKPDGELVMEAHRIIERKLKGEWSDSVEISAIKRVGLFLRRKGIPFLLGAATATLVFLVILLVKA